MKPIQMSVMCRVLQGFRLQRRCCFSTSLSVYAEKTSAPVNASADPPLMGRICDKKPIRLTLEEGKLYSWCTCGASKKQPFCDNSHREINAANPDKNSPQFKSHKFQVDKKKEYALCMCKQTRNRPFCDGTHKKEEIQKAV